ncbi:hypothetical protein [Salirhabdus sp. Marseille-P4669]|uniref:hypothetical protein n=1 Tax=Salirhabdus sp. Marseille-P4669 TaxID=2042310 RepID=UPI000C7E0B4D|nr:hypothetical protein [Salirhabdus sp. Marseille-P4669]
MPEIYAEYLFNKHQEQDYEKKKRYRNLIQEDPRALITLFYMEKIHEQEDDQSLLGMYGPPRDSAKEIFDFYKENMKCGYSLKEYELYSNDHPNYDIEIDRIYQLWKSQIKGDEALDEKIEMLEKCFMYIQHNDNSFLDDKRIRINFRNSKRAEIVQLNYPLMKEAEILAKERDAYEEKYFKEDPKALITLFIMDMLYSEKIMFPSPYPHISLAGPPYKSVEEIEVFYETHKKNGGTNFDDEIEQIYALWKSRLSDHETYKSGGQLDLLWSIEEVLFPKPPMIEDNPF